MSTLLIDPLLEPEHSDQRIWKVGRRGENVTKRRPLIHLPTRV
jgi:hypothetical protein